MEAISPQTFCYTKVKVGQKTIWPQDVSAVHVSWTFQSSKRWNNFGPYTFWYQNILAFVRRPNNCMFWAMIEAEGEAGYP